jgi:tRNA G46 methylase TrmB
MPSLKSERQIVSEILRDYPGIKTIADLGSGWGGLACRLAKIHPDKKITAVEKSVVPHIFSRIISFSFKQKQISHRRGDIFEKTLNNEEAYITYLSGPAMKKLRISFERDHPTGGVLISIAFAMPG